MASSVSGASGEQSVAGGPNKAAMKKKFDDAKAEALAACQGNPSLLALVNGIEPHKGAIEELEDLTRQGQSSGNSSAQLSSAQPVGLGPTPPNNKTLGIA